LRRQHSVADSAIGHSVWSEAGHVQVVHDPISARHVLNQSSSTCLIGLSQSNQSNTAIISNQSIKRKGLFDWFGLAVLYNSKMSR
jgi:hypothetical protein